MAVLFFQKMDRNKDGVVTIEEFIESCKKVEKWLLKYLRISLIWKYVICIVAVSDEKIDATISFTLTLDKPLCYDSFFFSVCYTKPILS